MTILIIAGGQGTRLKNVISDVPKAMAPMSDGKPFLEYLINYVKKFNPNKIIISTGYKSQAIKDYFNDKVIYSEEREALGTAGAISLVPRTLISSWPLVVINGDTFFGFDLTLFYKRHIQNGAWCSLGLARVKDTERYARIIINKSNRIVSIQREIKGPGLIAGGTFAFSEESLEAFPDKGSLEEDVIAKNLDKNIYGFPFNDYFIDIGIPEDYEKCRMFLPKYWRLS